MPKTAKMIMNLKSIARQHRKIITISGRVLDIPMGQYNGRWSTQSHKGPNFMTCGSAYDMLADTMIRCEDAGLADAIQFNMHDELVVSQSAANDIRKIMETPPDRLCEWAGRVPVLRTDRDDFEKVQGKRWQKA
jgi:DNA polymerase-1